MLRSDGRWLEIFEEYEGTRKMTMMWYTQANLVGREAQLLGTEASSVQAKVPNCTVKQQRITSLLNEKC